MQQGSFQETISFRTAISELLLRRENTMDTTDNATPAFLSVRVFLGCFREDFPPTETIAFSLFDRPLCP
jgi:hypothetical protein